MSPNVLAAGSNEIFRLSMRGYSSADGGVNWTGVDLPLPAASGANGIVFGSDPTLAFDTRGHTYYGYITVYFSNGSINGTGVAVAKSSDGGKTYPQANFFSFEGGQNHFNDKPMITADTTVGSPFADHVYIAWDAASGGSTGGGIRVASSADGGTFTITRADDPRGPGRSIGAVPFTGPKGELYVAWNDYAANTIAFNRSLDGGATWGTAGVISSKRWPLTSPFRRSLCGARWCIQVATQTAQRTVSGPALLLMDGSNGEWHYRYPDFIFRRSRYYLDPTRRSYRYRVEARRSVQSLDVSRRRYGRRQRFFL